MIGVMDFGDCCVISAETFEATYSPNKVYLGRNINLPQAVKMRLEFDFRTNEALRNFFIFWQDNTMNGAKPFYIELPLYGEVKFYLVAINGDLTHKEQTVSGEFMIYRSRTLDENTPPVFKDKSASISMDSTNNYLLFQAEDFDDLTYEIIKKPLYGVIEDISGGAYYYTPNDGFSGSDSFTVRASDQLGAYSEATFSLDVINWQLDQEFKTSITSINELLIVYANAANVDPQIQADLLSLSNATISVDAAGNLLLDYTPCTTITNITIDSESNLIITTI